MKARHIMNSTANKYTSRTIATYSKEDTNKHLANAITTDAQCDGEIQSYYGRNTAVSVAIFEKVRKIKKNETYPKIHVLPRNRRRLPIRQNTNNVLNHILPQGSYLAPTKGSNKSATTKVA